MLLISSPIPSIRVSPALPEKSVPEPYSPIPPAELDVEDDDGYRAKRLSVPPLANTSPWHSSPLRPVDCPPHKGLSRDQFDLLLKVSRDQRANLGMQKVPDLRKELAVKNQRLKQFERRARFLSKVQESPCPATISIPEALPESPTVTHRPPPPDRLKSTYSALEFVTGSPEDFIVVNSPSSPGWDEQVEAKQPLSMTKASSKLPPAMPRKSRRVAPSLDEITARLKPAQISLRQGGSRSRLPNFLKALLLSPGSMDGQIKTVPVRTLALNDAKFNTTFPRRIIPPRHPDSRTFKLELRNSVGSRTGSVAPEPTLRAARADTARDMIMTLRRRSTSLSRLGFKDSAQTSVQLKRHSAPAELQHSGRIGLEHVTLSLGGF